MTVEEYKNSSITTCDYCARTYIVGDICCWCNSKLWGVKIMLQNQQSHIDKFFSSRIQAISYLKKYFDEKTEENKRVLSTLIAQKNTAEVINLYKYVISNSYLVNEYRALIGDTLIVCYKIELEDSAQL